MLGELCAEVKNYFVKFINYGTFKIEGGKIVLPFLQDGQYFRIVGSTFNDGVYQYPAENLYNENFKGAIWAMAVPPTFIALASEIEQYNNSDEGKPSAYTSESWGGYSYSKATDSNGIPLDWRKVFASRINKFRRISVL
jgi:hypothetical protein